MNVNAVSSLSTASASSASTTSTITQIKRQIEALQKRIEAENSSHDDAATKAQKLQLYQTQLAALQAQLQLLQTSTSR